MTYFIEKFMDSSSSTVTELFKSCLHNRRGCENFPQGCRYTDMSSKCAKHEWFHCPFTAHCRICYKSLSGLKLSLHYESVHKNITYMSGSTWKVKQTGAYQKTLVESEAGTVVCFFKLMDKEFEVVLFVPVLSKWLFDYRASLRILEPGKENSKLYNLQTNFCAMCDWYIKVERTDWLKWGNEFDVCLNIRLSK